MRTIAELRAAKPSHVEGLANSLGVVKDMMTHVKKTLNRNSDEHKIVTEVCPACEGKGELVHYPRSTERLHPSSFGPDACLQRVWYDLVGELPEIGNFEPKTLMIFQTGHAVHDLVQGLLKDMFGRRFQAEVPARIPELYITGSCDGVLELDSARAGLEIKSINDKGFRALSGPKLPHLWQATTYSKALDLPFMVYLYFNKNTSDLVEYVIPFNPTTWELVEGMAEEVINAPDNGPGPVRPNNAGPIGRFTCRDCPYNHGCSVKPGRR